MREELELRCRQMIENRDILKSVFRTENSMIYPVCANIFCSRGKTADRDTLRRCQSLLKARTGVLSNFRGHVRLAVISMLAVSEHPEELLEETLENYQLLKQHFPRSEYLALVAMLLADLTTERTAQEMAVRGRELYDRMNHEHPILTSEEDSVFAVLLAYSLKNDDELIQDMEESYDLLKPVFHNGESVQSTSHVLAFSDETPAEKTGRLIDLCEAIRSAGGTYDRRYGLPVLATLAVQKQDAGRAVEDLMEISEFLHGQRGYRGLFGVYAKTRMTHAAMVLAGVHGPADDLTSVAAQQAAVGAIVAQQMALHAGIMASVAASSSSSHSSN